MTKTTKLKNKNRQELVRIAQYMVSGGAFFWTGYLVFFICDQALGLNLWWAKLLANISGWTVNYLLQRYWVFNEKSRRGNQKQVTGRYAVITLINFGLDYLIVSGLKGLGLTPYLGQFVSAGFFTVWNYLWYKLWVFQDHGKKKSTKRGKK